MSRPTALITGCSQGGIGDALAQQLANRGYHVFATVRNPSKAAHLAHAEDIELLQLDVSSTKSVDTLVADLKARLPDGKLDILVNNAGFGATGPLIEADLAIAKQLYDVNVLGPLAMTQAFAPMLIASKGKLVNISSVGGILAMPWAGLYHSSKAAVTILSETLRLELAPFGVTVITGMLGNIQSNFHINGAWQGLPESSRYKSVEAQIASIAEGKIGPQKDNVDDFARRFVDDMLRGASGQVWRGAAAQSVRILGHHAPISVLVRETLTIGGLAGQGTIALTKAIGQDAFTKQRTRYHGKKRRGIIGSHDEDHWRKVTNELSWGF